MLPIRDHNPSERRPYVTYVLIAANVLIFLGYWPLFSEPTRLNAFFADWALVPAFVSEGFGRGGFVTSMFLHGGWMHLGGNMLFLWIFGDNLEDDLGHLPFLGFYLACGIAAGLAQYLSEPLALIPMVGASGAIAGVMGGYLLMYPRARVDVLFIIVIIIRIIAIPAWVVLGVWFALQLFGGFSTPGDQGGVAYWAHAGGFLAGLILIIWPWMTRGGPDFWARTHGHPPHPETRYSRSSIPVVRRKR